MKVSLLGVGLLALTTTVGFAQNAPAVAPRTAVRNTMPSPSTSAAPTSSSASGKAFEPARINARQVRALSAVKLPSLARNTACARQMVAASTAPSAYA